MSTDNKKVETNSEGKEIYPERNVKVANIKDIVDQINVSNVSVDDAKKLIKEVCGISDINNKIIVVRISYDKITPAELNAARQSLIAINEVLFKHNSSFVFMPDLESITGISIEEVDSAIKALELLKEKINENNSNAGSQAG